MNSEHNDDLQDLLDQLNEPEDVVEQVEQDNTQQPSEPSPEATPTTEPNSGVVEPTQFTDVDQLEDMEELGKQVIRPVDADTPGQDPGGDLSHNDDDSGIDVEKYHKRLDSVTDEILTACRSDRQEAQDVIDLLRHQIDDATSNDRSPQRMWVDGLVKAVEVKAGINATAVKIVEANAKMLAATKNSVNILNQNVSGGSQDLEDVLSRPLTESDEY